MGTVYLKNNVVETCCHRHPTTVKRQQVKDGVTPAQTEKSKETVQNVKVMRRKNNYSPQQKSFRRIKNY